MAYIGESTEQKEKSKGMGLSSASTSLGRVVGPLWGGFIYDLHIEYPFYSVAATLLLGLLVSLFGLPKQPSGSSMRT